MARRAKQVVASNYEQFSVPRLYLQQGTRIALTSASALVLYITLGCPGRPNLASRRFIPWVSLGDPPHSTAIERMS